MNKLNPKAFYPDYDGAGQGKRVQNWTPTSASINSILSSNSNVLRNRSRDLVRKNPYAANAINSIVANCVGTGIKPQSKCADAEFRKEIQRLWLNWTDQADYAGLTDFYGLQALILRSVIEGGECLVRLRTDKESQIPLKLQVLEAEYLDSNKNGELLNGNTVYSGVEVDKKGTKVAYWLFLKHPGDNHLLTADIESVRIPAKEILHIYNPQRPGQLRGEPWLSNVLLKLHELDQYEDAELVRKKTSAMFAGFVTRLDPDGEMFDNKKEDGFYGLEPGTMQFLEPGEDVKFSSPADVGTTYEAFIKQQLRSIAIGMGITYEQLTGDLSAVNYSSIRAGSVEFRRRIGMLQHHFMVYQLCRPVWNKFIELAILNNQIKVPKDSEFAAVKWIPQGFEWVDPLKEQNAQMNAVRCGFKSRAEVVSELGYDVEEIDTEIAADQAREKELGLNYDSRTVYYKN